MKIAILHDFFGSIGGGEKLVLEMAEALNADIYTTYLNEENVKKITNKKINLIKQVTDFPLLKVIHSSYAFSRCKIEGYDLYILSGNWAVFAAKNHKPNSYYMHTPVRMFYDSKWEVYKQVPWYSRFVYVIWTYIHAKLIEKYVTYVDEIITNSKNTQKRIKKYHQRNSKIIYPPIKQYKPGKYENYWLSVNRLYPHKRVELQIECFRNLPDENLIIIGDTMKGDHSNIYKRKLLKSLPKNVKMVRGVDEKALEKYYSHCKGFITTSLDEDFGMSVLEAMSAGKPVVAVDEGGYKETVNEKVGFRIKAEKKYILKAIKEISKNPTKYKTESMKQAKIFNAEVFKEKIKEHYKK